MTLNNEAFVRQHLHHRGRNGAAERSRLIGSACALGFDTQIVKRDYLASLLKAVVLEGKSTLQGLQRAIYALPGGLDTTWRWAWVASVRTTVMMSPTWKFCL
mgnify:CR=1 FL=1